MNETFTPIRQRKISEEIADQLKSTIFLGKLKPGQKLPPERELAKSLNVSRVSLREALNTLQGMGLIEIQRGNRTFVRPITTRSMNDPLVAFCKSSPWNILQVLELRKHLEIGAASLAAERASEEHVAMLQKIMAEMEEDFQKNRLGAQADLSFHHTILEATNNLGLYSHDDHRIRFASRGAPDRLGRCVQKAGQQKETAGTTSTHVSRHTGHEPQKAAEETRVHLTFVEKEWRDALMAKK